MKKRGKDRKRKERKRKERTGKGQERTGKGSRSRKTELGRAELRFLVGLFEVQESKKKKKRRKKRERSCHIYKAPGKVPSLIEVDLVVGLSVDGWHIAVNFTQGRWGRRKR